MPVSPSFVTELSLPSPEEAGGDVRVALTVRPLLETGVVLVLTSPLAPQPVLIVGLVQGEVRASLADVHDSIANKNFTK